MEYNFKNIYKKRKINESTRTNKYLIFLTVPLIVISNNLVEKKIYKYIKNTNF